MPENVCAWELLSEDNGMGSLICAAFSNDVSVPFWRPAYTSWTISAIKPKHHDLEQISLWDIPCQKYILMTAENTLIQLHKNDCLIQLECPADIALESSMNLDFLLPMDTHLGRRAVLVRDLQRVFLKSTVLRINEYQQRKLRGYFSALEADLVGKSYRDIAIRLWGKELVSEEWDGGGGYLKSRARRYVARGHYYMNGGYRDLLKK